MNAAGGINPEEPETYGDEFLEGRKLTVLKLYEQCVSTATAGIQRLNSIYSHTTNPDSYAANSLASEVFDVTDTIRRLGSLNESIRRNKKVISEELEKYDAENSLCQRRIHLLESQLSSKRANQFVGLDQFFHEALETSGSIETNELRKKLEEEDMRRDVRSTRLADLAEKLDILKVELLGLRDAASSTSLPNLEDAQRYLRLCSDSLPAVM